jgi:hypothetical protein
VNLDRSRRRCCSFSHATALFNSRREPRNWGANMRCVRVLWYSGILLCVSSPLLGQTGDGYIGIYRDSLGTEACASVPQYTGVTLFVIAKTAGQSADGIAGAEFRIEITAPEGWYISYNPPSSANIVSGCAYRPKLNTYSGPI